MGSQSLTLRNASRFAILGDMEQHIESCDACAILPSNVFCSAHGGRFPRFWRIALSINRAGGAMIVRYDYISAYTEVYAQARAKEQATLEFGKTGWEVEYSEAL